jgi:hypothetical protein
MDSQDAETRRPSAKAATEAATINGVPLTVVPPRNSPIRGVSDSASQRAQAQDEAETAAFMTNKMEERLRRFNQDQGSRFRDAVEKASQMTPAWASLQVAQAQRYIESQVQLYPKEDANAIRQTAQQFWINELTLWEKLVFDNHVCYYCSLSGHIKECCPRRYSLTTPVQIIHASNTTNENGLVVPDSLLHASAPDFIPMEGHATKMAQLSEHISSALRIASGTTAEPSESSGSSRPATTSSRESDSESFAQMSNKFFEKLNATHLSKCSLFENIQATFQQQNGENVLANERERKHNSQLLKDMAKSFFKESEDYTRKKVKSSLEVQLELMEELRKYQAQAINLNAELKVFQDNALKNTTKVADLIILGL